MSLLFKPIVGLAAAAAVIGVVGILLLAQPEVSEPVVGELSNEPTPDPDPAPVSEPVDEYVSPPAAESEWGMTNATVEDLIGGILLARDRNDLAWLARTMESTAAKETLVEDDLLAAHRQYTWTSIAPMWNSVGKAWTERAYRVEEDGNSAELVLVVGGSLGELILPLVRINGAWYYAGI